MNDAAPVLGLDVGGTFVRAGVVAGTRVVFEHREKVDLSGTLEGGPSQRPRDLVVSVLAAAIRAALSRAPDARAVGVAVPGFIDPATGKLARSPNLPGLEDVDLAKPLAAEVGLPVVVENDALAAAWGEWQLHPKRPDDLLYVGLGTGVGGGAVLRRRPWRGAHGVAMEVGHLIVERGGRPCGCGNRGCLEQYASATGVSISYRVDTGEKVDAEEASLRASRGDEAARRAFERAGTALGTALAHVAKILDVADVVVGGGLSLSFDAFAGALRRRLDEDVLPVQRGRLCVVPSAAKDLAGMIGAAGLAAEALEVRHAR